MRLCKNLAPPVKTVDEIVLITHVPCIFPDPAAQFNARKKNGCDQKPNQDAPNEIPGGSRHYLEMQESSNTHSPPKEKDRNSLRQVTPIFVRNSALSNRLRDQQ